MKFLGLVLSFGVCLGFGSAASADWLCEEDLSHVVKPPGTKTRGQFYSILFKGVPVCDSKGGPIEREVVCQLLADVQHRYYRLNQTYYDVPVTISNFTRNTRAGRFGSEYTVVDLTKAFGVNAKISISKVFEGVNDPRPIPIYSVNAYLEEKGSDEQGSGEEVSRVKLMCERH